MVSYPPYVNAYGKIEELFKKIREAAVPSKVTNDFLYTKLGLKSTSYRAMIPLLKKLDFIDEANVPKAAYRDYRDEKKSKIIMAQLVKSAYKDLFATNEYANKLKKEEIISKLNTVLGTPADDKTTPLIAASFLALCSLADFESKEIIKIIETPEKGEIPLSLGQPAAKLGISYTINLNLPATTDIEVFNAIFKALKENLLR
jgi:hypothetical protein